MSKGKIIKKLQGKKTHIVLSFSAVIWLLEAIGILPSGTMDSAIPILTLSGGATIASKINRLGGK